MEHRRAVAVEVVHAQGHVSGDLVEGCMVQGRAGHTEGIIRVYETEILIMIS